MSAVPRGSAPIAERAREWIAAVLAEDLGSAGDVTSAAVVPPTARAVARLEAREELVVAGLPLIAPILEHLDARGFGRADTEHALTDGQRAAPGTVLGRLRGSAWAILAAERLMLNLVGRLSGIATVTSACVAEVRGTRARVADTRKTTPGLRELEKYAVSVGGGETHRPGLDAMVLVKDNHKQIVGGLEAAISHLEASGVPFEAMEMEVESPDEAALAAEAGFGWILLDNMTLEALRASVERIAGRAHIEVSGGLRPGRLRPIAELGVDRLSLGCLTHGARSVDVALEVDGAEELPGAGAHLDAST